MARRAAEKANVQGLEVLGDLKRLIVRLKGRKYEGLTTVGSERDRQQ